jgi:hypothetical protein
MGTAFSVRSIVKLVPLEDVPRPVRRVLAILHLVPSI